MVRSDVRHRDLVHATDQRGHRREIARELDSRVNDGIAVRLLWHPDSGRLSVGVNDTKTGERFEVLVREGDRPLEVFHHPYAFAAWRGMATSEVPSIAQAA